MPNKICTDSDSSHETGLEFLDSDRCEWWSAFSGILGVIMSILSSLSQIALAFTLVRQNASNPTFFLLCLVNPLMRFVCVNDLLELGEGVYTVHSSWIVND